MTVSISSIPGGYARHFDSAFRKSLQEAGFLVIVPPGDEKLGKESLDCMSIQGRVSEPAEGALFRVDCLVLDPDANYSYVVFERREKIITADIVMRQMDELVRQVILFAGERARNRGATRKPPKGP